MSTPTFKDHFSARSDDYARHRPTYPRALAEALAARAPSRGVALEVGAGSGQLSVLLGDVFEQVIATDASAAQIEHATPHPHVRYAVAPAEHSTLPDASVDLVVAAQAAHWFDLDAFYTEVRRVAKAGAVVALVSYGVLHVAPDVDEVLRHFHFDVLDGFWPPERKLVDDGYRTIPFPFPELDPPLPALAMTATWDLGDLLGYVHTWSGVSALAKTGDAGRARIDAFEADLAARWGDSRQTRDITWPLAVRAGRIASRPS